MTFRETVIVSGGLLAQQVTVFVTGVIIARDLGAGAYGTLGTLKSLFTVLVILTPLGLDLALLKHASFYHDRQAELKTVARALRLLAAGISLLLLVFLAAWGGGALQSVYRDIPDFARLCVITTLGLLFAADIQISGALFRVSDRVVLYAWVVTYGQPIVRLALSCLVLAAGFGVIGVVWVNTLALAITFVALRAVDRRVPVAAQPMPMRLLLGKATAILSESLWMALSLLVYQMLRLVDVIILAALTTVQATGEYNALSSVAQLIQIYPLALSQTLGPRIAVCYRQADRAGIEAALRSYLRRASILGGYLYGGVAVFGTDLDLVFGRGFAFSWVLAFLLATGWYVSATLGPLGYVLSMTGRHRREVFILGAGAAGLVASLLLLVPPLGTTGAALSVAMTFVAVNAARSATVIRILGVNPLRLSDLAAPALFLLAALLCRSLGGLALDRHLSGLVAECLAYSVLAAGLFVTMLASDAERDSLARLLRHRRRLA